jgi:hypothetical protein
VRLFDSVLANWISPPKAIISGSGEELVVDRRHGYHVIRVADVIPVHVGTNWISPPKAIISGSGEELVVDRRHGYHVICMADVIPR